MIPGYNAVGLQNQVIHSKRPLHVTLPIVKHGVIRTSARTHTYVHAYIEHIKTYTHCTHKCIHCTYKHTDTMYTKIHKYIVHTYTWIQWTQMHTYAHSVHTHSLCVQIDTYRFACQIP